MNAPREGSVARQIFDLIAEFPGVKVTTAEIAAECQLGSPQAAAHAHSTAKRGYIKKEANGVGSKAVFWVEP